MERINVYDVNLDAINVNNYHDA